MAARWQSQAMTIALPMSTVRRLCARGPRRTGVAATFAHRDDRSARLVVWSPGTTATGTRPIGTFVVQWAALDANEAVLGELSWPPTSLQADLWQAIEELAGQPIPRSGRANQRGDDR